MQPQWMVDFAEDWFDDDVGRMALDTVSRQGILKLLMNRYVEYPGADANPWWRGHAYILVGLETNYPRIIVMD